MLLIAFISGILAGKYYPKLVLYVFRESDFHGE